MGKRSEILDELISALDAERAAERRYAEADSDIQRKSLPELPRPNIGDYAAYEAWIKQDRTRMDHQISLWRARTQAFHDHLRARNAAAAASLAAVDELLTVAVRITPFRIDDQVEPAVHPPFERTDLETPIPPPRLESPPPEPVYVPPAPPTGIKKLFGGKRQFLELEQAAQAEWAQAHGEWSTYVNDTLPATNKGILEQHQARDAQRLRDLASARAEYEAACSEREEALREAASSVTNFRNRVLANEPEAVLEFLNSLFLESPYPPFLNVTANCEYDAETREATVEVTMAGPSDMPAIKSFKHMQNSGEVRETRCSQTEQKSRYNSAVAAVAVRSIFEVFTAEPAGVIDTLSLTVGAKTVDPATGKERVFPFISTAAAREDLLDYELGSVDPVQTLKRMNALVSKNAFALQPIVENRGVRK